MIKFEPLDKVVPISEQIKSEESPVVLVNIFQVDEADIPQLLKGWEEDANWMKKQPGYISTQLHRGIAGSTTFLNYAVWESVSHFRTAFMNPEFKAGLKHYPDSTVASPGLFTRLKIANLCVGP